MVTKPFFSFFHLLLPLSHLQFNRHCITSFSPFLLALCNVIFELSIRPFFTTCLIRHATPNQPDRSRITVAQILYLESERERLFLGLNLHLAETSPLYNVYLEKPPPIPSCFFASIFLHPYDFPACNLSTPDLASSHHSLLPPEARVEISLRASERGSGRLFPPPGESAQDSLKLSWMVGWLANWLVRQAWKEALEQAGEKRRLSVH